MPALPRGPQRPAVPRPTRGAGLLESLIARMRHGAALGMLPAPTPGAAILDIGCGVWPAFLLQTRFARKVGLDPHAAEAGRDGDPPPGVELMPLRLSAPVALPFPDGTFSCVASLAVIEHLDPGVLPSLASEMYRVLKPGGRLVLTTPHAYADPVLRSLARLGLASPEEIEEHQSLFRHRDLRDLLQAGGFPEAGIRVKGLLFGLNILALADK